MQWYLAVLSQADWTALGPVKARAKAIAYLCQIVIDNPHWIPADHYAQSGRHSTV
ncbi:MAG: hypothetical protein HC800_01730 [Phormidesmis sp. RL_2_1]|nr:hypothetical protein [Phormidesmis sp. RL_2_1]